MFGALTWIVSLLLAAGSADVVVVTIPPKGDVAITLAPAGKADLKRDSTVTWVRIDLDHLSPAATMGPAYNAYVVWAVSPEGTAENIGELALDKDKGHLEATTHFEQLGVLVTAEPHYMVDRPSSAVAFRSLAPKSGELRRVTIPVTVGSTDYSALQSSAQGGVPTLVAESRAAVQIAKNAGADRFAEAEFRQARIAIDTMEQMISRAGPFEIVAQSANEAIRRSQQAVVVARARETAMALDTALSQITVFKLEKLALDSKVEQLASLQSAAIAQVQSLQHEIVAANRDSQQLAADRDQAVAHDAASTQELNDLKKKQEDLQPKLWLTLTDEFFDLRSGTLTPAGHDALAHLSGLADAVPGQIRLVGPAPDALFEAARQYLIQAGIAAERIILKR